MSWRQFILALGLHIAEEMETAGFGLYWVESARQISDKGDLSAYWRGISYEGDFLGAPPSYTHIRDPMLSMDVGSVNIPYLLARYLRMFASGRKHGAMISGGQFICEELDGIWDSVAPRPKRQPAAMDGTLEAPQPPPAAVSARSLPQRVARLEEEVYGMRGALGDVGIKWLLSAVEVNAASYDCYYC
ncbi:hypothetical protein Tco_0831341 [Tanacetum coccineum]